MTKYDPATIQGFADRLYSRTISTMVINTVLGALVGMAVDPFIHQALPAAISDHLPSWGIAALLAVFGFLQGWERSYVLKIQAQTALCQMQIEQNTRNSNPTNNP